MKSRRYTNRPRRRQPARNSFGGGPPLQARTSDDLQKALPFQPRPAAHLKPVLKEIGIPADKPFTPDPFQIEAIKKLRHSDVIVTAPTGSGKTYIAVQAMAELLSRNGRVWYASPLKALSNSKFLEFGRTFGPDKVGLLTGDHKVNPEAPLIVGTTEILRNQLYDAMSAGISLKSDLIIMDEAHYLGDTDRGVVWEEVLIYLPVRVRLLLLSATVANAREIAGWLGSIRGQQVQTVESHERPVPLHPLFLFPDGLLTSLSKGPLLSPQVRHFMERGPRRFRPAKQIGIPYNHILKTLGQADLLPAIFFLKSRADCDLALGQSYAAAEFLSLEHKKLLQERLTEFLSRYPFLENHPHLYHIHRAGLAAHHAGHLPHWKLLIEQLMQEGLLAAIFSTSTVAAGVNFPARTVVLNQSDRFNGREFVDLSATELLQMTGRAGRRGMDRIGFALIIPGTHMDPQLIHSLFASSPDPVRSQIQINFSMTLNLLLSYSPEEVKNLLDHSLAAYQQSRSIRAGKTADVSAQLVRLIPESYCRGSEEALVLFQTYQRLDHEIKRLTRSRPKVAWEAALSGGLTPGRLFEVFGGKRFCVLERRDRRQQSGVSAAKLKEDLGLKKGRVRRKWVALARISALFDAVLPFTSETRPVEIVQMIRQAAGTEHKKLAADQFPKDKEDSRLSDLDAGLALAQKELDRQPCRQCPYERKCLIEESGEQFQLLKRLKRLNEAGRTTGRQLWSSFLKHMQFLVAEGLVTDAGVPTSDGEWAAQLRLDHPLLIAAGIRVAAWPEDDPPLLAGLVAPFVVDKELPAWQERQVVPPRLAAAWRRLDKALTPLMDRLKAAGFDIPVLDLRAALAVLAWAGEGDWEKAVRLYGQDQGDMAMLALRTADNLRQMASLSDSHPGLAAAARAAVGLILKEPVLAPL